MNRLPLRLSVAISMTVAAITFCCVALHYDQELHQSTPIKTAIKSSQFIVSIVVSLVTCLSLAIDLVLNFAIHYCTKITNVWRDESTIIVNVWLRLGFVAGLISVNLFSIFKAIPDGNVQYIVSLLSSLHIIGIAVLMVSIENFKASKVLPLRFDPVAFLCLFVLAFDLAYTSYFSHRYRIYVRPAAVISSAVIFLAIFSWALLTFVLLVKDQIRRGASKQNSSDHRNTCMCLLVFMVFESASFGNDAAYGFQPWQNVQSKELSTYQYLLTLGIYFLISFPNSFHKFELFNAEHSLQAKTDLMKAVSDEIVWPRELVKRAGRQAGLIVAADEATVQAVKAVKNACSSCSIYLEFLDLYSRMESGVLSQNFTKMPFDSFVSRVVGHITSKFVNAVVTAHDVTVISLGLRDEEASQLVSANDAHADSAAEPTAPQANSLKSLRVNVEDMLFALLHMFEKTLAAELVSSAATARFSCSLRCTLIRCSSCKSEVPNKSAAGASTATVAPAAAAAADDDASSVAASAAGQAQPSPLTPLMEGGVASAADTPATEFFRMEFVDFAVLQGIDLAHVGSDEDAKPESDRGARTRGTITTKDREAFLLHSIVSSVLAAHGCTCPTQESGHIDFPVCATPEEALDPRIESPQFATYDEDDGEGSEKSADSSSSSSSRDEAEGEGEGDSNKAFA